MSGATQNPPLRVFAVVVTFNPDINMLARLISGIAQQVESIILVDNGDGIPIAEWLAGKENSSVTLLPLGGNKGIAVAQNEGIAWARARKASHIILFDHDSDPPSDLVVKLHGVLCELERSGKKVAAVGPHFIDSRGEKDTSRSPFSRFEYGRMTGVYPPPGSHYVEADFLIASGSLIPVTALDAIGGMMDELFIDYVDIEWGVRARSAGWSLYGVWDVLMEHSLGDDYVQALGHSFPIHSPLRHYYVARNALWLALHSRLAWKWKYAIAYNGLRRFVAYALFMPQRFTHTGFMCRGFWHGIIGRMGAFKP